MSHTEHSIAPTAYLVAYHRTFSDIPYSKEIFELLQERWGEALISPDMLKLNIGPQLEARYKLVTNLLLNSGIKQVLEVAAGFSSRGMSVTNDSSFQYVEIDTEGVALKKREMVKHLVSARQNLILEEGNGLSFEDLERVLIHFDVNKPLAIINEGLMRYLTFNEKETLAKNVRTILQKTGGVWITPDISLQKTQEKEDKMSPGYIKKISHVTSTDIAANRFKDEEQAKEFFEGLGFTIERHPFTEVTNELTSPAVLGISSSEVEEMNKEAVVFVMRPV